MRLIWLHINMERIKNMLMPVILATQEANIRRIPFWTQHKQIVCKTLSWIKSITKKLWWSGSRYRPRVQTHNHREKKKHWKLDTGIHTYILATLDTDIRRMVVQSQPRQIGCEILSGKYWCMAQVVEHLPGKCEALSSNPVSKKKKKITSWVQKEHNIECTVGL
jgi:hypothetical protein